jgi:hypothetical protein
MENFVFLTKVNMSESELDVTLETSDNKTIT